jgi:3-oxosteroid 1-dehydrogenase
MQMLAWDSHDADFPNFLTFAIWDQRAADRFPGGSLGGFIPEPDGDRSHVVSGNTLAELAGALDRRQPRSVMALAT